MASNGIVDYAFDPKPGVPPTSLAPVLNDMVLLVKCSASTDWPLLPLAFSSGENLSSAITNALADGTHERL